MSDFRITPVRGKPLGPEFNPWYWNPSRWGVRMAPHWFSERLHSVGEELEVTWNPITERWQVFMKAPRVNHKICQGWKLLFIVEGASGEYMPLDERIFAFLYAHSVFAHGDARRYFERVVSQMERDAEKAERDSKAETIDRGMPTFEHSQISVAMRGHSNGSKFSTYHA